jgi:hypothetical protein
MRIEIANETVGRTFTLFVIKKGDPMIRKHREVYEGDEPLVGIFDKSYNFDTIPFTQDVLGYMIKSVPLSELHQEALECGGTLKFDRDITDWSLDADGVEKALEFMAQVEADLGLSRESTPSGP